MKITLIKLILNIFFTIGLMQGLQAEELDKKEAFIERFYQNILGRDSDEEGMQTWLNTLENESATKVAMGFLDSQEFENLNLTNEEFLDIMYKTMFDRKADERGKLEWLMKMEEGRTKQSIMFGFFNAQEFKNLTNSFGVTQIQNNDKPNLSEVESFVDRFYTLVLKRDYDENGFNNWVKDLSEGNKKPKDIAFGFLFSPEYINQEENNSTFLDTCYEAFFGRAADNEGKADWLYKMENEGYTREQVFDNFIDSQEFSNLVEKLEIGIFNLEVKDKSILSSTSSILPSIKKVGSSKISKDESKAYLITYDETFIIIDLKDTLNQKILGSINIEGYSSLAAVTQDETKAFLFNNNAGIISLLTLDISNPTNLSILDSIEIENQVNEYHLPNNKFYLSKDEKIMYTESKQQVFITIDITNPSNLSILDSLEINENIETFNISEDETTAYLGSSQEGFIAINITNPSNLLILDSINLESNHFNKTIFSKDKTKAYIVNREYFITIDINDPSNLLILDSFHISDHNVIKEVYISKDETKSFLLTEDDIFLIDISNETSNTLLGSFSRYEISRPNDYVGSDFMDMIISEDESKIYIAAETEGLLIVNITNPSTPTLISQLDNIYSNPHFILHGGYVYPDGKAIELKFLKDATKLLLIKEIGYEIIDITNPTSPYLIKNILTIESFNDIILSSKENILYSINYNSGIDIVDLAQTDSLNLSKNFLDKSITYEIKMRGIDMEATVFSFDVSLNRDDIINLGTYDSDLTTNDYSNYSYYGSARFTKSIKIPIESIKDATGQTEVTLTLTHPTKTIIKKIYVNVNE